MSRMGFYSWVRENVKQAVLLGFSDAIEHLGMPESGEVNQNLLSALRETSGSRLTVDVAKQTKLAPPAPAARKRLGKSFEELREGTEVA